MSKRRKIPRKKIQPQPKKQPRIAPQNLPDTIMHDKPKWRISFIDYEGPWGFNNLNNADMLRNILDKLKNFEGMAWNEIEGRENHLLPITKVCRDAKKRLKDIRKDDYQDLFSFRLTGRERLWGIRQREAFYILWWDPDHTVYPVEKSHT